MANEAITVSDPVGHTVFLLHGHGLAPQEQNGTEIYDDIIAVIERPAILIQVSAEEDELYYYRSIGWHHTMLLIVRQHDGRWEAVECVHNPPAERLSELMKKGKQLI